MRTLTRLLRNMLIIALFQTAIFGILVFTFERLGFFWLVVADYNSSLFTLGETGLIFFIIFLLIDFISEFVRYLIVSVLKNLRCLFFILAIIIAFIQLLILGFISSLLTEFNIISITLVDSNWSGLTQGTIYLYMGILIFIPELIVEIIRSLSRKK